MQRRAFYFYLSAKTKTRMLSVNWIAEENIIFSAHFLQFFILGYIGFCLFLYRLLKKKPADIIISDHYYYH